jgi:peptide/nickel transport system permease protein
MRRFLLSWQNVLALGIVAVYVLVALLAPLLAPPNDGGHPGPFKVVGKSSDLIPRPPREGAPLGTMPGQLDVYHTLIWGTRSALRFGLAVTLIAACIGVAFGALGGYLGGASYGLTMRVTDAFLAFPAIAAVLLLHQVLLPPYPGASLSSFQQAFVDLKLSPVLLALILFSWMPYARLTSAMVLQLRRTEYVQAARAVGARNRRVILRHLLPNALSPAVVMAARDVGAVVILASAFTFIGMGQSTEWGTMLVQGRDYVIGLGGNPLSYWWVFLPVTLALILFGVGWNLLGDGLNDFLNPQIPG